MSSQLEIEVEKAIRELPEFDKNHKYFAIQDFPCSDAEVDVVKNLRTHNVPEPVLSMMIGSGSSTVKHLLGEV